MPRPSLKEWIAEQDRYALAKHDNYRRAAAAVAAELARLPGVSRVCLFGSVAQPLKTKATRKGWEMLHDCKDIDLAVWLSKLDDLADLQKARQQALARLLAEDNIGVAHHQVEVFLFVEGSDRYRGRLCAFGVCPKGKPECRVKDCGQTQFLRQHEGFRFFEDALDPEKTVVLYDRREAAQ